MPSDSERKAVKTIPLMTCTNKACSCTGMEGERRRYWQRIMARNQIESCWCRKVPRAGYMCDDCFRAFRDERPKPQEPKP